MANLNTDLLSPEQAIEATVAAYNSKDAIEKIEGLVASASEINDSVKKTAAYVTPEMFGTIDGTNDTTIINNCLSDINSDVVFFGNTTYLIDSLVSIKPRNNQIWIVSEKTKFKSMISVLSTYSVITIEDISRLTIIGTLVVEGESDIHTGTTGEWGMGVSIFNGCKDIFIDKIYASNCWGDGVYISSDNGVAGPENIHIGYIESYDNRRQGVSIVSGNNINIEYMKTYNIIGAAPEAGVDIEPNETILTNINIGTIETFNNNGSGLTFERFYTDSTMEDIHIKSLISHDNNKHGISANKVVNFTLEHALIHNNAQDGIIMGRDNVDWKINNVKSFSNGARGLACVPSEQVLITKNIVFRNCDFFNNSQLIISKDGARVEATNGTIDNIKFLNCKFYDDQTTPTQRYGFSSVTTNLTGLKFDEDCKFYGNTVGDNIIDSKYERLFLGLQTNNYGTTRPNSPKTGQMFFDSTLSKPIWWNGTSWRDSTGTSV